MIGVRGARDRILLRGSEDWVSLAEVAYLVRGTLGADAGDPAVRHETLRVVAELVGDELVEVGEVDPLFRPWDGTTADAVRRIEEGWPDPGQRLRPGDVCWFANTALGGALAEEMVQRFGEHAPTL